jgi:hypothetical protein
MKSKVLTKKTILNKVLQGINDSKLQLFGKCDSLDDIIEPLVKYIERNTDIEVL